MATVTARLEVRAAKNFTVHRSHDFTYTVSSTGQTVEGLTHNAGILYIITKGVASRDAVLVGLSPHGNVLFHRTLANTAATSLSPLDLVHTGGNTFYVLKGDGAGAREIEEYSVYGTYIRTLIGSLPDSTRSIAYDGLSLYVIYSDGAFGTFGNPRMIQISPKTGTKTKPVITVTSTLGGLVSVSRGCGIVSTGISTLLYQSDPYQYGIFASSNHSFERMKIVPQTAGGLNSPFVNAADGPRSTRQGPMAYDGKFIYCLDTDTS